MKEKIALLFCLCLLICGLPGVLNAQCALDQNQPQNDGGTSERNLPGYYDWQSFTAGISGELCQVDVLFCNTTTLLVGTGTLNIYDGTGIGGTLLSSQAVTVDGSATPVNLPFWQNFMIASPPNVVSGQVYTWQFIPTQGGGLTDPYLIQVNIPDVYAGGVSYNFGTGGDIAFATYVDATMGIIDFHSGIDFTIYPNPATDLITVKPATGFVSASYTVKNELGMVVLTGELNAESSDINISELSRGIYFLSVGEKGKVMKVVKE